MSLTMLQTVLLGSLGWLAWKIWKTFIRCYFVPSSVDNLRGPKPTSLLLGNFGDVLMSHDAWAFWDDLANEYGGVAALQGFFGEKSLYVSDPTALHTILVKEQSNFPEPPMFLTMNQVILGNGLLSTEGAIHRKQRKILNPAFSPTYLRRLTPVFARVATNLRDGISAQLKDGARDLDLLKWMSRAALEFIGQGGLGYSFDPLVTETGNPHRDAVKGLLPAAFNVPLHLALLPMMRRLIPRALQRPLMDAYPVKAAQRLKGLVDLLWDKASEIIVMKKTAVEKQEGDSGKDIISILLRANAKASTEDRLPDDQLIAQVNTLISAATDTSSNLLARIMFLLSTHPELQDRLRREIVESEVVNDDDISYDKVIGLQFLDAVYRETARVYPVSLYVQRVTEQDTVLPLWRPVVDKTGRMFHELPISSGTPIMVSIHGYNRNKAIWGEDASEWKPERWLAPLPETLKTFPSPCVYSNILTFNGGPRSCIGFKYAELEVKTILCYLLSALTFSESGHEILWNTSQVVYPTTAEKTLEAKMVVKVGLIQS